MKRREYLSQIQKLSPADLKKEAASLEQKLQGARLEVAFGKSKKHRDIRNLKHQLAQALTVGNQKLRQMNDKVEK